MLRYCVSARQPKSVLKQADEIYVQYKDRDIIMDFVEEYPDKTIILDFPVGSENFELANWGMYSEKFENFYIALHNLTYAEAFNKSNIKWYWPYPITSYYELDGIIAAGASSVVVGMPLTHDMHDLRSTVPVPIRATANLARPDYLAAANPIIGFWIRPEDVDMYEGFIDCLDFHSTSLTEEAALLKIYKEKKEWMGNLNFIIHNLNYNVDNRAIEKHFAEHRFDCGQRCLKGSTCHYCERALQFSTLIKKKARERT